MLSKTLKYLVFFWTIVIIVVCSIPGKEIPQTPFINIPHFDKIVHAGLYFVLSLFSVRSFKQLSLIVLRQHPYMSSVIYAILLGVFVEIIQHYYIPNRAGEVLDALANTVGSILAVSILFFKEKN